MTVTRRAEVATLQALLSGLGAVMAAASLRVQRLRRQVTRDLVIEIASDDGARQQYRLHAATRRLTLTRGAAPDCALYFSTARQGLRALLSRRTIGRIVEGMNAGDTRIDGNPVLMLWFHGLTRVVAPIGSSRRPRHVVPIPARGPEREAAWARRIVREPPVTELSREWPEAWAAREKLWQLRARRRAAPARMTNDVTELNPRARGWLRFLWDKATTADDWSSAGEPHRWWDRASSAPMCAFPRFDLGESAYALPLMCEVTPAWREVYTRIAREFCERHMTFWAAIDALVTIGEDPNIDWYPPEWQIYMPERLRGKYAPPGWIGNGDERWGFNPDPIAADGNVFFRGFFNLLLSVYAHVSGDTRYHEPFQVSGYLDRQFRWTQPELAQFISDQLADRPEGIHCENTKIWPFCVSATGLGLKAYDAVNGTRLRDPYDAWTEFAQQHYMGRDKRGDLEWFAFYYDPIERQACSFPDHVTALGALVTLPYIYPQRPDWGLWLYEQCVRKLGWSDPRSKVNEFIPDPRGISIALMLAHEVGDDVTEARLREHVERSWEPRFFGAEQDRFGFFFGWGEEFPRGQQSALLMIPEVGGRGSWDRWSGDANLAKFSEPTVEGVDFPSIGLSAARNDLELGELHIATYAATPSHAGRDTTFRVTNLPDPARVRITCDGQDFGAWRTVSADAIEVDLTVGTHRLVLRTGYHGAGHAPPADVADASSKRAASSPATPPPTSQAITPSLAAVAPAASSCRCC